MKATRSDRATNRVAVALRRTFASLRSTNYRLYFSGQIVSASGTWMQTIAQSWLVLKLSGSGTALGLVTACQFLPVLLLSPLAGVVVDRLEKRRLLYLTQGLLALLALLLGVLTATDTIRLWMMYVLAFGMGTVNAFDVPGRQTFVFEMVGPELLSNAVTLNSVVMNGARVVGPAIAGLLITTIGLAPCFLVNGLSFLACIAALGAMRQRDLVRSPPSARHPGQLRQGLSYVWREPALRTPLLLMAAIGTLAYEFQVSLPLVAKFSFAAGADAYAAMTSAMGLGAVVGGLVVAHRGRPTRHALGVAGLVFGLLILLASAMPTLAAMLVVLPWMGAASIGFIALANSNLQLASAPEMRGRVMALYSMAFLGSTPVGGPIVGWVGEAFGARWSLALGGVTAVVASLLAWRSLQRHSSSSRVVPSQQGGGPEASAPSSLEGAGAALEPDGR